MQFLKNLISGLLLAIPLITSAQFSQSGPQPEVYNQFYMNPYLYNPAYAGVEGHSVLFLLYNQRWNINDAPQLIHASFHTPLPGGLGIGVTAFNTSQGGLLNRTTGKVSGSYLVSLDRKHHLRFGMSLGGGTQTLQFNELDDPSDPAFLSIADNASFLIADFGMTYHFDHFNVGFSIPNLISYDIFQPESFAPVTVKPLDNLMFKVNYRGHLTDDIAIEPHLIYRYSQYTPDQLEAAVIFHIYHIVWLSAGYRQDNNFIFSVGTKVKERLGIGYAFEMGNPEILGDLGPTHEVHLGLHIGNRRKHHAHAHSFIKSHRLTAEERAKKAELEREQQLAELQASRQTEDANDDALTIAGGAVAAAAVAEATDEEEAGSTSDWKLDESDEQVTRVNEFGEAEKALVITRTNAAGEEEQAIAWVPAEEDWQIAEDAGPPLERTASDGSQEIGVKYYRTDENGNQELVVKWEPVVTPEQGAQLLAGTALIAAGTQDRAVDIPVEEPTPEPVIEEPVAEEPVVEEPVVQDTATEPDRIDEVEKGDEELTDDFRTHDELGDSDDHLVVTRGNHLLELPAGHYVVAGAFESFEHAENFSDELFEKGYHDVIVGYISARGYYYVVTARGDNLDAINRERDRERQRPGMSKVWVLHVKAQ